MLTSFHASSELTIPAHAINTAEDGRDINVPFFVMQDTGDNDPLRVLMKFQQDRQAVRPASTPFNTGNETSQYWFYTRIHNKAATDLQRRVIAVVPTRPLLRVFTVNANGELARLLDYEHSQPFTQREQTTGWPHRWLQTPAFTIAAGETLDVLVQYHVDGASYIPLDIVDDAELYWHIHNDTVSAVLFYAFSIAAIALFLLFGIAMRDRTAKLYGLLFLLALLMLAAMEGYGFMVLWPNLPAWNQHADLVLSFLFCGLGFFVANNAVEPSSAVTGGGHSALPAAPRRLLTLLAFISLGLALLVPVMPRLAMMNLGYSFIVLMFAAQAVALMYWYAIDMKRGNRRNLLTIVSIFLIALLVIVLVILSLQPGLLPPYVLVHASRLVFILSGLAMMAAIISHVSGLRDDYADSLERVADAAQREADINHALFESEKRYNRTRELARARQQQLAEASHDMKQPLFSLRSTLDSMASEQTPEVRNQLNNAFDYLQNLCAGFIKQDTETSAVTQAGSASESHHDDTEDVDVSVNNNVDVTGNQQKENLPAELLLGTLHRMFSEDAQANQVEFKIQPSSCEFKVTPTVVIRIVANMIANAIRHAGPCKLLVGVRRKAGSCVIVVIDNGKGIASADLERLNAAYEKGPDSEGSGLGLAICRQQARQNGMVFHIHSEAGKGTCCQLEIPSP